MTLSSEANMISWSSAGHVGHLVLTRFMQHPRNLLHLGESRIELFRSFCLPTILKQRIQ
jgi:hypothetical protein